MTTLQMVAFVVLWIVIITEGALLFLLYRHVGLLYARRADEGLAAGMQAPPLLARDAQGTGRPLSELLSADLNLLVFGSPTCSGCRALLTDRHMHSFLAGRAIPGYFLLKQSEARQLDRGDTPLAMLTVDEQSFGDYRITLTPFAYIVTRMGTIVAGGPVGGGLRSVTDVCDQALQYHHQSLRAPIQVEMASAQRMGR